MRAVLVVLTLGSLGACAGQTGWRREERRTCAADDAPRLCVLAGPDAQQVVTVGGASLVPGECAAGSRARGGPVEVGVRDGRRARDSARKIRVRVGETAMISAVDGEVVVQERRRCER